MIYWLYEQANLIVYISAFVLHTDFQIMRTGEVSMREI